MNTTISFSKEKIFGRTTAESIYGKYFEPCMTTESLIIPGEESVKNYVKKIWGNAFVKLTPPAGLEMSKTKRVKLLRLTKDLSCQWSVESLRRGDGIILPNAYGLAIILMKKHLGSLGIKRVWGLDIKENLCLDKSAMGGCLVPYFNTDGYTKYPFNSACWGGSLSKGDCVAIFCD